MEIIRFALRRLRAQRALAVAIVVTLAFAVGAIASAPIFIDGSRAAIYGSTFANAAEPVRDIRISLYAKPIEWRESDRRVRDAISDVAADAVVAQGLASARLANYAGQLIMMFRDRANDHLTFTEGRAPRDGEVAIPAGLAFAAGIGVGDELPVLGPSGATIPLRITGIFEPPPRTDPFFFGEASPFSIPEGRVAGSSGPPPPVVTTRSTVLDVSRQLDLTTSFSWDVYLPWDRLSWQQAQELEVVQHTIDERLHGTLTTSSLHVAGGIPELIGNVRRSVGDLETPVFLVALQILLVGLAVVAGVGVLLAGRQGFELAILHSRGFPASWLFRVQLLQTGAAAVVALPIGLLFARGLAAFAGSTTGQRAPGIGFPTALSTTSVRLAAVAAMVAAVVLALPSIAAVRRTIVAERHHASREGRSLLARLPVELVVLPVGLLALVQLRQTAPAAVAGATPVQPLLLFAPALLILGATFLVVRLLLRIARALDGPVGRSRRLSTYLAGRHLARAGDASFAAALLVVLSVGLLVVATTFRATSLRAHEDTSRAYTGAAWVADLGPVPGGGAPAFPTGMTPVARFTPQGTDAALPPETTALAVDPSSFEANAWWRDDLAEASLADLLEEIATPPPGLAVAEGPGALTFTLTGPDAPPALEVRATFAHPDGSIETTAAQRIRSGTHPYRLDIGGAERLLSITFASALGDSIADGATFALADVAVDGAPVSLEGWSPVTNTRAAGSLRASGDRGTYSLDAAAVSGAAVAGIQPTFTPLPAIVSEQVGMAPQTLRVAGIEVPIRPVATSTAFPGMGGGTPFVVVSQPALADVLRSTPDPPATPLEAWSMAGDPTPALADAGRSVADLRSAAVVQSGLDQRPPALAMGMDAAAAIAALALVVVGVAVTLYVAQRRRAYEFAALTAMGTPPRNLRGAIFREQLWLVGSASLAGLALGRACVLLALPQLRASIGVRFPTPILVVDAPALLAAFTGLAVATYVAIRAAGRALTRLSVTTVLRGEVE
jgi:hypothetical protein